MIQKILFFLISLTSTINVLQSTNLKNKKEVLIIACGRSGTQYMSKLLSCSTLDIKHEQPGINGCVSWPMVCNSYSPWGPSGDNRNFIHILHQVRHPLSVITSWYNNFGDLQRDEWRFIRKHIIEIKKNDSLLTQIAKYWYYWNLKAEALSEWRFKIEDIDYIIPKLEKRLNITLDKKQVLLISKNTNTFNKIKRKIKWSDLKNKIPKSLFENIQRMAQRYGYSILD